MLKHSIRLLISLSQVWGGPHPGLIHPQIEQRPLNGGYCLSSQTHKQQALSVQTLMEVAYGPQKVEDAKSNLQLRKKLANTWDEDIFTLHDRGWRLRFDPDTYPATIQPIGMGREDTRRPRGFFEELLDAYILDQPPR